MDEVTLPPSAAAAGHGRAFVEAFCRREKVPDAAREDAVLMTSELVTNAYVHAQTDSRLQVDYLDGVLRVAVADGSGAAPSVAQTSLDGNAGRGLLILDGLSRRWGVQPQATGKIVWFELSA